MTTLLIHPVTTVASNPPNVNAPPRHRGAVLFVGLAGLYFAAGYVLVMRYNLSEGDAGSRVANAGYVLMSRDPHLSAIGFVWNPLPSLVEIPILLFDTWWPDLRTHGLAGVVQSALFMAGSATMVRGIALDRGVGSGWRRMAVACFALQPMIIVYGASGMSEAAEVFCVLWCVRYLMRWADDCHPRDLAWSGIALGVGYLTRYEVAPAALGAAIFVAVLAATRASPSSRIATAIANCAIVLFPITVAATIWALSGWVVNHELFATLTSQYGNTSQVAGALQRGFLVRDSPTEWVIICGRLFGMQPFAGVAAAGAVAYAALARRSATLVPVVTFGAVLTFAAWGEYSATTFGWFRFYLLAIPLVVCIALACWKPTDIPRSPWAAETYASRLAAVLMCLSIVIGFPVTVCAELNDHIDKSHTSPVQFGFNSLLHPQDFPLEEQWYRQMMVNERLMAQYLDRQRLPEGSVLMDTAYTWAVWVSSERPAQFVVSSDYDFRAALNRPWQRGVKFLILSNPSFTDADAINLRYPTLWNDGAGFSKLVYTMMTGTNEEQFRLYEVTGPPRTVLSPPA